MKTMILLCLLSVPAVAFAGNPDQVPSVGFTVTGVSTSGDNAVSSASFGARQDANMRASVIGLDIRLPVADSLTLTGALGAVKMKNSLSTVPGTLAGATNDQSGTAFSVGVRIYLQ